jgi:hypothetical protein
MKFCETLETAERMANGKIEEQLPYDQIGCFYQNQTGENGEATSMSGLCLFRFKNEPGKARDEFHY